MTALNDALEYAARGWRVIPIAPGTKYPKGFPAWQDAATTDPAVVEAWWTGEYRDHGVGIVTGRASGLWVLDIDDADSLADLEAKNGTLPDTREAITGSGGRHLFYAWDPALEIRNNQSGKVAPGIDVRGDGGFVVAPPSVHPNGTPYEWELSSPDEPVPAPEWLLELVCPPAPEPEPPRAPAPDQGDRPGDRWAAETSWAELLIPDGFTLHHVDREGEHHWTRPGKDKRDGPSVTTGYTGNDNLKVFTSSLTHLGLDAEGVYTKIGYLAATRHGGDHAAAARDLAGRGWGTPPIDVHSMIEGPRPEPVQVEPLALADVPEHPLERYLVDWSTFWTTDHTASDWLLEPLFAAGRAHALYAGAKTGKSFVILAACAALASGRPFLAHQGGDPVDVLYVDYEMTADDLAERLEGFGYSEDDDLSRLHYALLPSLPPLDTPDGGAALVAAALHVGAQFVVIDTMGRAVEGDENDANTFQAFYRYTGMRLKRAQIGWMRLDHAGKDAEKGMRGSSAKTDDVDLVLRLTRTDSGVAVKATHRRIGWYPEDTAITIDQEDGAVTFRALRAAGFVPGTKELAAKLDELEVPTTWGKGKVRPVLTREGVTASNRALQDAIRYRKTPRRGSLDDLISGMTSEPKTPDLQGGTSADQLNENPGNQGFSTADHPTDHPLDGPGGPVGGPVPETHTEQGRTTPRTSADHLPGVSGDQSAPLREGRTGTPDLDDTLDVEAFLDMDDDEIANS